MTLSPALKNDLKRWYVLKDIPEQLQLLESQTRFKVICAGRRSGKTERAKRHIIKQCMTTPGNYFIAAPTYAQVKLIYWDDVKRMSFTSLAKKSPSESELIVYFNNGSKLYLIGLDKPKRIEGVAWMGGLIDEAAYVKEEAWITSVAPSLDTANPEMPGYKAWCWILGKPDGFNWYYKLYQYALTSGDPEWSAYTWKSIVVLDAETIEAARRRMSAKQFRQEYEASFETVSGRIYDDYCSDNYTDEVIQPHEEICYFCDFNYTPMSHGIGAIRGDSVYVLDEIILESAVGEHNALEFVERYKDHKNKSIRLYGDQSGRNGEKHSLDSEYTTMERVFKQHGWRVDRRVQSKNPSIKDSQNAVRAKIRTADDVITLFVNPNKAPWMHEGLATVTVKEGSSFLEDDKNDKQHITTALRYFINYEWPIDGDIIDLDVTMWGQSTLVNFGGY